jgi:hypothetical protein
MIDDEDELEKRQLQLCFVGLSVLGSLVLLLTLVWRCGNFGRKMKLLTRFGPAAIDSPPMRPVNESQQKLDVLFSPATRDLALKHL